MNKFRKNIFWSAIFILGLSFIPAGVFAATNIDTDLPTGPIITENNILPGDTFSRTVTITKLSDVEKDEVLMIRFDAREEESQPYALSQKILVSIKKVYDNGKLAILPNGTTQQPLEELYDIYADPADPNNNNGAFEFDTVYGIAGSPFQYQILFTFDPATEDKNFQNSSTVFDISMGIYSNNTQAQDDDGGDDGHNRHHAARTTQTQTAVVSGALGLAGTTQTAGIVGGAEIPEGNQEMEKQKELELGASTTKCTEWPFWVWILILIGYVVVLNTNFHYKLKEKVRWFLPLVWTTGIFLVWYYFEKCRLYAWYPYAILIIAILSFFVYLSWIKKKLKKEEIGRNEL